MNNFLYSLILTSIAGLSTIIGYFIIFLSIEKNKIIAFSLSFSSSVMLTISLIDLLPSAYKYLGNYNIIFQTLIIVFFFLVGIFISNYLSHIIESNYNDLKKIGIISLIIIILHNIPEGIITFVVSKVNFKLGLDLAIAIGMHNIPEGISIAIPLYYENHNKFITFIFVLIAGLSEILGAIICYLLLKNIITNFIIGILFSIISGIMINISLTELLPESFKYNNKELIYIGLILGLVIMIISHIL